MKVKFNFRFLLMSLVGIFSALNVMAQDIVIKGHVQDETGEPIYSATVQQVGTSNGCVTDIDGNFSLKAPKGAVLRFSFIGYKAQEIPAAASMKVTLEEDSELLEDVVVIGYGVAKKTDMTGAVTAIKPDPINKGLVTNAQDMIAGKIAGVNVTSASGTPGAGADIRVRGGSSLNASNSPLIVIDGLAMDNEGVKGLSNPLSMVNPADIESFTVLKDASATAIYGSRGSNGVIIITTKKGLANQRPTVTYNGNVSVSMKKKTIDVMDGNEYAAWITELYGEGSDAWNALGKNYATDVEGNILKDENGKDIFTWGNTDWQDEIYRTAVSTDHNVTIAGGLKNMPYRLSLGYTGQQGILKTSDFKRYTASLNLAPTFFDKHLSVNVNAKAMLAKTNYANTDAVNAAVWMDPTQSIRNSSDEYKNFDGYFQWLNDGSALEDPTWSKTYNSLATKNPVALLEQQDKEATSKSLIGNVELDYKIHGFEDLRLHANFGGDFSTGKETTSISPYSSTNAYYGWNGWDETDKYNLSFNAYAQYMKDFNDANHFDIMAGYEWQHFHREGSYDGWGLYAMTNNRFNNLSEFPDYYLGGLTGEELAAAYNALPLEAKAYNRNAKTWKTENYIVSFFGRMNYSLLDRYLFTATVRHDGSSRFKDHWATFPSFAFGWRLKEEAFLKDVDWMSDAKVRLGYGQTGQQDGIGDYNYFASYNVSTGVGSSYPLGDINSNGLLYRPDAYNKDLTWETTTTYNAGLDLAFWNNRFNVTADYYFRETTDLLNTVYVAAGSNFRNQVSSNVGSLENQGIELAVSVKPIVNKDWYWEINANVAYNENEITELIGDEGYYVPTGGISAGTGNTCQAHAVGHPANSFYVYQQVYDEQGLPIEGVYVDRDGNGIINQNDRYFYKSPAAPWTAGLSSKVTYKNFDFGFSLRASIGNYVFNDLEAGTSNVSTSQVWAPSGYLSNRPKNVLKKNWQTYDNVLSDYFVQNASFLKCDNITLGYSFDKLFNAKISGRVYGSVTNVFTITDYKGIDPEVGGGIDNGIYPRPITAQLGLTLNF